MAGIDIDASDVERLVTGLTNVPARMLPEARAVVAKGAVNIKKDWAGRWSGLAHAPSVGRAVTYDLVNLLTAVEAEIGPDKERRQGALGNLIEFGSVNNGPIPGGLPALQAEEPRFLAAIEQLAADVLEREL